MIPVIGLELPLPTTIVSDRMWPKTAQWLFRIFCLFVLLFNNTCQQFPQEIAFADS